jgi:hypothetical protein
MPLRLNSSGGGSVTLDTPSTASTYTLTVPAITGTAVVTGSSGTVSQGMLASGVAGTGPAFSAWNSGTQSLSATTSTKVNFDTEEYDTASCFSSSRFTPNVAGYYLLVTQIRNNTASSAANWWIEWRKNGSLYARSVETNSTGTPSTMVQMSASRLVYFNGTTDYAEIYAWLSNGGTIGITSDFSFANSFQGFLVRAA